MAFILSGPPYVDRGQIIIWTYEIDAFMCWYVEMKHLLEIFVLIRPSASHYIYFIRKPFLTRLNLSSSTGDYVCIDGAVKIYMSTLIA